MSSRQQQNYNKVHIVQSEIDIVKDIVSDNIEKGLEGTDHLEELSRKTTQLCKSAQQFNRNAKTVKNKSCFKLYKMYFCAFIAMCLFIWFFSSIICGFDFSKC